MEEHGSFFYRALVKKISESPSWRLHKKLVLIQASVLKQTLLRRVSMETIRKTWETYVFYNKQNMSQDELAFHQTQSAHRKETVEGHYVKHSTQASDFYHNTLKGAVKKLKEDNGSSCSTYSRDTPCSSRDKPSSSRELPRPSRDTP